MKISALPLSWLKLMPPFPENLKLDVSRSSSLGKKKIKEHVLPEAEGGMSKLKIDEMLDVIWPFKELPRA